MARKVGLCDTCIASNPLLKVSRRNPAIKRGYCLKCGSTNNTNGVKVHAVPRLTMAQITAA